MRTGIKIPVTGIWLVYSPRAFESVYGEEIYSELDGALCVPDSSTFVENDGTSGLQLGNDWTGAITCSLDDLDTLVDNHLSVGAIVRGDHGRQKGDVNAEWVFGHLLTPPDLISQVLGCGLGESCEDTQPSRIRHGSGQLSISNILHATLHDRNFNAQAASQLGVEGHLNYEIGGLVPITLI